MNRIYCAIGKIIEQTQKIELSIADVCELSEIVKEFSRHEKMTAEDLMQVKDDAAYIRNKMLTMTFGQSISIINEARSLDRSEIEELRALLEKRNYFAHEYFKYTNFGEIPDENFILEEFTALKEYLKDLKKMAGRLDIIKDNLTNRLNYLTNKAGL